MDAPSTTPGHPQPIQWTFTGSWKPEPGSTYTIVQFHGADEGVMRLIEQLGSSAMLVVQIDAGVTMPPDAWDHLPPRMLTPTQQAIVREDLRGTKRTLIAQTFHISPATITAYRTTIRKKFLGIPPEQRPVWMQIWLRYFPGMQRFPAGKPADTRPRGKHS
ncbi:MAG: hypothetical protein OHK0022_55270 [Roseiflexaceae bacterium]